MKMFELLDSPEKLCRDAVAKDSIGQLVRSNHPDAVKWCLIGAGNKCALSKEEWIKLGSLFDKGFCESARVLSWQEIHAKLKEANL